MKKEVAVGVGSGYPLSGWKEENAKIASNKTF